jgi:hypothetical protein
LYLPRLSVETTLQININFWGSKAILGEGLMKQMKLPSMPNQKLSKKIVHFKDIVGSPVQRDVAN